VFTGLNLGIGSLMMEDDKQPPVVHGKVKWFDPGKGFGFIVADGQDSDILLHANVLRNYGQNSIADGTEISVRVQRTAKGVQAVEVLSIKGGGVPALQLAEEAGSFLLQDIEALAMMPARVKWFDKAKGFGFANLFGQPEDVFIHAEVLRVSGFADLQPGEAVCLRVVEGRRGRMAVQVAAWETATRAQE
jgi:CspA family cold shock protein